MDMDRVSDESVEATDKRRRWPRLVIGLGVLLALVPVGWVAARTAVDRYLTTAPSMARAVGNPIPVVVAEIRREEITELIGGTTLAESLLSLSINAAVSEGRISEVKGELGALVRPGQALLGFDTGVFREALERSQLQVRTAKSELQKLHAEMQGRRRELVEGVSAARGRVAYWSEATETAAKTYQRLTVLWDRKVIALTELEQAKLKAEEAKAALASAQLELTKVENELKSEPAVAQAQLDSVRFKVGAAEQELARTKRDLENTVITGPTAGIIAQRSVNPGEWVKSGKTLFALDQIDPIYAVASIEQEKSSHIRVGQSAEVVFDSFPSETFQGKVAKIEPSIDPAKRTFKAFVALDNRTLRLRPGMAAFTRIRSSRQVTLMPRPAVINPTGSPSVDAAVFVVDQDTVALRQVKLGRAEGPGHVEVLGGIEPGQWVVVHGQRELNPGDRVTTRTAGAPTGGSGGGT